MTTKDIHITKADKEDLPEILALQKVAFLSEAELYNNYSIEPLTQTKESIEADYETHLFLKAMLDGNIIGSVKIGVEENTCRVGKLMVAPGFLNRGIGRQLLLAVEQWAPKVASFVLFTGSKSTKNIHLYEKVGYRKVEEFTDEANPAITLVKMVKPRRTP